jgi:sulfite reductase (NADPH) flavoprotein alpha-component
MLTTEKLKIIEGLVSGASQEELIWMNGYLSGLLAGKSPAPAKPAAGKVTIAYGTETGNAKKLATDFAARARKKGIQAKLVSLDQYKPADLQKEEFFITVISTQGEGDPPDGARKFYEGIHKNGFRLERLKYGVLALGDTSYPMYCKAGEDVDAQLNKLGGERLISLQKCDTDFETDAEQWFAQVLQQLNNTTPVAQPQVVPAKTGKKTYTGTVVTNINLNDHGSAKQTHHIEIAADDVVYQPGDALGILPANPATVVQAILSVTGAGPDRRVAYRDETVPLEQLLLKKANISYLSERVVAKYAALLQQDIPATRMSLLDLLRIYPAKEQQLENLWQLLEPNAPRLYSISSSPEAHAGEIHLTVARDRFELNGTEKYGLCSDFFCQLPVGAAFDFYIHKNNSFRLPAGDADVIMIGPGTGIAPFRSFLAHRDATAAAGRNWLFFGDQHFATDFLYQTELQNWAETGLLTRINTAFSRDQAQKVYVQHRMLQHSKELFAWIDGGASVYVCGAREPMSIDVESALQLIIMQEGKMGTAAALAYLEQLKEQSRYLKDVY